MTVELPLTKANRIHLARAFHAVPRVDVAIESVIEGQVGKAFVDNLAHPQAFRIEIGPFLYFAGDPNSAGGQAMLAELKPYTLLMQSAENWDTAAQAMYGSRLITIDRYSFSDEQITDAHLAHLIDTSTHAVQQMDRDSAETIAAEAPFFDLSDFDSAEGFIDRSVGFYMKEGAQIIAVAYGSLVCATAVEVSIFVAETHHRRGIATALAAHLLQWCRAHNTRANWDAANPESCGLAEKLGYVPKGNYKAYVLKPVEK